MTCSAYATGGTRTVHATILFSPCTIFATFVLQYTHFALLPEKAAGVLGKERGTTAGLCSYKDSIETKQAEAARSLREYSEALGWTWLLLRDMWLFGESDLVWVARQEPCR